VFRGSLCGSSPYAGSLGAVFVSGGVGVPLSHTTIAEPRNGWRGAGRMPQCGTTSGLRPGASAGVCSRAPIVRASMSAVTIATWWSP
jgi:hypothetical protein